MCRLNHRVIIEADCFRTERIESSATASTPLVNIFLLV